MLEHDNNLGMANESKHNPDMSNPQKICHVTAFALKWNDI